MQPMQALTAAGLRALLRVSAFGRLLPDGLAGRSRPEADMPWDRCFQVARMGRRPPELHSHQAGIGGRPIHPVVRVVDEIQWRLHQLLPVDIVQGWHVQRIKVAAELWQVARGVQTNAA